MAGPRSTLTPLGGRAMLASAPRWIPDVSPTTSCSRASASAAAWSPVPHARPRRARSPPGPPCGTRATRPTGCCWCWTASSPSRSARHRGRRSSSRAAARAHSSARPPCSSAPACTPRRSPRPRPSTVALLPPERFTALAAAEPRLALNAFAHVAEHLARANARLREAAERDRGELERRVSERTAAIEGMNRRVQRELAIAQRIQRNLLPERRREFPGVTHQRRVPAVRRAGRRHRRRLPGRRDAHRALRRRRGGSRHLRRHGDELRQEAGGELGQADPPARPVRGEAARGGAHLDQPGLHDGDQPGRCRDLPHAVPRHPRPAQPRAGLRLRGHPPAAARALGRQPRGAVHPVGFSHRPRREPRVRDAPARPRPRRRVPVRERRRGGGRPPTASPGAPSG